MEKWQGQVSATLDQSIKPDQAWSLLGDFSSIHKFHPSVATCRIVEGTNGVPGCVRYCAGAPDANGLVLGAKSKLVAIDPIKRSYSYQVIENNMGWGQQFYTMRVVEAEDGSHARIEWLFECDPVPGLTQPDFVGSMGGGVEEVAKRVEDMLRTGLVKDDGTY